MNMQRITHDVQQGTGPWLRLREGFDTASEAPAALGVSKYLTRGDLMRRKHTGVAEDHSQATLAKFRAGHEAEARARPLAEQAVAEEFFPVTMSVDVAGLRLLASLDGMTLDGSVVWETKLWNEELATAVRAGPAALAEHYTVQMDQELFVSGADRCLFTCTNGTPEKFVSCWYEADPAKFDALLDGWMQFRRDLATYTLPESAEPAPVGKAPESLPALRIEVTGQVTASNLAEFKATALGAIRSVNRDLQTDQDFADARKAIKWCEEVESRIAAAKQHALSQTATIDELFRVLDSISDESKTVRLDLTNLDKRRSTEVKEERVSKARRALDQHIVDLNAELAPLRLQPVPADFAGAIKGKRSIDSMQDALANTLAAGKIAADAQARQIRANVATFAQQAGDVQFLFSDLGQIVHKAPDDFAATLHARIAQHRIAEEARESARKKAEAERIASEARRLADEQVRQAQEAERKAQQAAQAPAAAPTPAPAAPVAPTDPQIAPTRYFSIVGNETAPRADEPATLKLGAICERLGFVMSAAFLADVLHVRPARTDGRASLFTESQYATICRQLASHVSAMAELYSGVAA